MKNWTKILAGTMALMTGVLIIFSFTARPSENLKPEADLTAKFNYDIIKKWELPEVLKEVSGIAWIGDNRLACVQDEDGTIFIYNLESSKVEKSIPFADGGDYEGVTIVEDNAYVLRSDGVIFEVAGFMEAEPQVKKYITKANQLPGIDIEGLCADPANNRLLLAVKKRKNAKDGKETYAFDLEKKESDSEPLFVIDLSDPIFEKVKDKKKEKFAPGEIGIHPQSGEFYILDGSKPKLLITEKDGALKELYMLDQNDFGNPEGLTFSPDGDLFISNEADKTPANILQISLNRKTD